MAKERSRELRRQNVFLLGPLETGKFDTRPTIAKALSQRLPCYRDAKHKEISLRGERIGQLGGFGQGRQGSKFKKKIE